ncbi:MAG: aspartate-semialdehyde dehydrogenase [Nitrospina sp.]|jgi:aspartate-semialdehyde dehydrogenase|nr:aspartate-semialdehyde dehydrogenase [Nitrospina sp.]MBT3510472.1 aspartate-semialdehyde dehydrogenase [Nitrospina sp.]MBT3875767.1 aspartate-semialdehyde dehydrogenase [Nitrospina sp.]MBT4049214.1 aspartate-semialdehyde dehydrogenase [Nitrospina sp.]MBT4557183.1 aspartate-semialdehyde dehydrogenase [Nitrospina sp.]
MLHKKGQYNIAVAGATGAVGRKILEILEERDFPVAKLKALASARSVGQSLKFKGNPVIVEELTEDSFEGVDIALFSAGAGVSRQFAPFAVKSNCIVIDNSSAFRMEPDIPLVVPEVNPDAVGENPGIIANPNCSTIQMVVALKPIHDKFRIKRVIVSTYQSVSGSGQKAINELRNQTRSLLDGEAIEPNVYPHQIAFNCIPHIDTFIDNGYTKEEMKMVNETQKILGDSSVMVSPTTVRVPVFYSHSESVNVETISPISAKEVKELLSGLDGLQVFDDPASNEYPLAIDCAGKDEVFVGRIRDDITCKNAINFWVVSDNLRKGAALNAVQIAEYLVSR